MNFVDLVLIVLLAALVGTAIFLSVRRKKKGGCGCGCEGCTGCDRKNK